jgi:hypothetical protein
VGRVVCFPRIQFAPGRSDLAFPVHLTSHILHAVTDRFLVRQEMSGDSPVEACSRTADVCQESLKAVYPSATVTKGAVETAICYPSKGDVACITSSVLARS